MKRLKLSLLALSCASVMFAQRTPSHPLDIKDASFNDLPTYLDQWLTGSMVQPKGVSEIDDQFFISRVKPLPRIVDGDYTVHSNVDRNRKMCLWVPLDDPTSQWKSLPRYCFEGDNFSLWSYIDIHGNWTSPWIRSTAGLTDVAHKNGVTVGCVMSIPWAQNVSFNSWGNIYGQIFAKLIEQDINGNYKYSEALVKKMKYYGINGLGVNSEFYTVQASMNKLIGFFVDCHKKAKEIGWKFEVHWYDLTNESGRMTLDGGLGDHNKKMFGDKDNISVDMMFANYNWTTSLLQASQLKAEELGRSSYDYYAGFDIQGRALRNSYWDGLRQSKISIGFWGAHSQSLIHQSATDDGSSDIAIQKAYLLKQELMFSGGNRNPAVLPSIKANCDLSNASLKSFHGLATYLTAKSTIQNVPFVTRFNLGNGLDFKKEGKVTFNHKWHNLNTQDYMPTWRWWITDVADKADNASLTKFVNAELTFDDAYWGGSCLSLKGATPFSRVKLFKTMLEVQPDYEFSVTYKMQNETATHAKLFVALKDKVNEYKEIAIPAAARTGEWTTFKAKASELGLTAGDKVAMMGIVVDNTSDDYQMLVGEMALRNPAQTFATVAPTIKEVKILRGRYNACDFKIRYASKEESGYEKTYNDEVGTWYYEIYFQQKDQPMQLLTATTSWAAYVVDAPMVSGLDKRSGRIGVRAVSPDGNKGSEIQWSNYVDIAYDQPGDKLVADKPVIKPGEKFTIKYEDDMVPALKQWSIVDPVTSEVLATASNATEISAVINKVGVYDIKMEDTKNNVSYVRGQVKITPTETGAVPVINEITTSKTKAETDEELQYTYTSRDGEGKVSRALVVKDPNMFMAPGELQVGKTYSYALWFKADAFNHDKQGTNLINKNTIADKWPHNNWGDLWVTIRPTWKTHPANEVSFNTMGWEAHDEPYEKIMSKDYSVTPGVWNHIVVTHDDNNNQKIYFNGKKVADGVFSSSTRRENKSDNRINKNVVANIFIGGGGVYKAGFVGAIDEMQIWNKALSDAEVLEAMKGYKEGEVPMGLQGYYTFEAIESDGTFKNLGKAGTTYPGKLVAVVGSGGESTAEASYAQQNAENNELGYPGIIGSLDIKTTSKWVSDGIKISSEADKVAVVTYQTPGTKDVELTLSNPWGKDTKTMTAFVEISGETGVDAAEVQLDMDIYPNPFAESVNFRFAQNGDYAVRIFDMSGKLVQNNAFAAQAGQVVRLEVTGNKGIYVVQVLKSGKLCKAVKIVKN